MTSPNPQVRLDTVVENYRLVVSWGQPHEWEPPRHTKRDYHKFQFP